MKNKEIKIITVIIITIIIIALDYFNLPSNLGLEMSNVNWNFLNIIIIVVLYIISYKILDARSIERENNKNAIVILLIKNCYNECLNQIDSLKQEIVVDYIIPKMDFKSTHNSVLVNCQNFPFINENIIMDFVKDGQVTKHQVEGYFNLKEKYMQYITMRITLFDAPEIYEPLRIELKNELEKELKELNILYKEQL